MPRNAVLRLAALLLVPALVGACGVGAVQESTFVYGTLDVEGGTVAIEEVTLEVPAGALAGPTTVGILPEANPLPIQPPVGDACEYLLLGPQYCCGPVGLDLLVDARLTVRYDPALIPAGVTEDDLVLLLWDAGLGALVPGGAAAVHDAAADAFVVDAYAQLGHLAVAYGACPRPGIVFLGFNPADLVGQKAGSGGAVPTADEPSGLWLVDADGTVAATQLPTGGLVPRSFLPAPDGQTVLYEMLQFEGELLETLLYGVAVEAGVPIELAGDGTQIDTYGPTFGWMRDGSRVFFVEDRVPPPMLEAQVASVTSFSTVPGDGSAAPLPLYDVGTFAYVDDVRQSPDGDLVMLAYYAQSEELLVDVIDAATGQPVSQDAVPYGRGHASPRFLPDSSGLYLVDADRETVQRYDPDGAPTGALFTPPAEHGRLKDFVLAPNGDDYAYVAIQVQVGKPTEQVAPNVDVLHLGSLSGGLRASIDLGVDAFYRELFFHPSGAHVFLESFQTGVLMLRASDGVASPSLGIGSLDDLDISADDGRLLLVIGAGGRITGLQVGEPVPAASAPGLYVADPDGQNQQLVATPTDLETQAARWLRSVRRSPGMAGSSLFR